MEEKLKVMAVVFIVFPAAFLLGRSVGCKIREYLSSHGNTFFCRQLEAFKK